MACAIYCSIVYKHKLCRNCMQMLLLSVYVVRDSVEYLVQFGEMQVIIERHADFDYVVNCNP